MTDLEQRLEAFRTSRQIASKGQLSVILFLTRQAKKKGLPLDAAQLLTKKSGQISGLSNRAIQKILAEYGITRVLAKEGGRTSRGGIGSKDDYVSFLNDLDRDGLADLDAAERWWIDQVRTYFASQPFVLKYDVSLSMREVVQQLLEQARERQKENPGATYLGTMLQHLVGAKLELVLKERETKIDHHGASVADAPTAREGDFVIDGVAIHVTTSPSEALISKCKKNLDSGFRPIIVTIPAMMPTAEGLADIAGIVHRVDILAVDQFLATNIHELSGFQESERKTTLAELIEQYNRIVDAHETDPSLRISMG